MIELYTWPTPNGVKIHMMLEETGLEYNVHPVNIQRGDQFDPEFLKLSPNNKMPAMIDTDGRVASRSRSSSRAPCSSISAKRPGCSIPRTTACVTRRCAG